VPALLQVRVPALLQVRVPALLQVRVLLQVSLSSRTLRAGLS
jgi:hypothetical protein